MTIEMSVSARCLLYLLFAALLRHSLVGCLQQSGGQETKDPTGLHGGIPRRHDDTHAITTAPPPPWVETGPSTVLRVHLKAFQWQRVQLPWSNQTSPYVVVSITPGCKQLLKWRVVRRKISNSLREPTKLRQTVAVIHPLTGAKGFLKTWQSKHDRSRLQRHAIALHRTSEMAIFTTKAPGDGNDPAHLTIDVQGDRDGIATIIGQPQSSQAIEMPADKRLRVAWKRRRLIRVQWKAAFFRIQLNATHHQTGRTMEYCVTLTTSNPSRQYCETELAREDGTLVSEKCFKGHINECDIEVPVNTYLNVFAIDRASHTSYRYGGGRFGMRLSDKKVLVLGYGKTVHCHVKPSDAYKLLLYRTEKAGKTVRFSFFVCTGSVAVVVSRGGRIVHEQNVVQNHHTYVIITEKGQGPFSITLLLKSRRSSYVRVIVTGERKRPYPNLITLRQVREWSFLRTCNSVAVSWISLQGKNQYCIYLRENKAVSSPVQTRKRMRNSVCALNRDLAGMNRVKCTLHKPKKNSEVVTTETVTHLSPCTEYTLQLYVMKRRFHADLFAYEPLVIRTACDCHDSLPV